MKIIARLRRRLIIQWNRTQGKSTDLLNRCRRYLREQAAYPPFSIRIVDARRPLARSEIEDIALWTERTFGGHLIFLALPSLAASLPEPPPIHQPAVVS